MLILPEPGVRQRLDNARLITAGTAVGHWGQGQAQGQVLPTAAGAAGGMLLVLSFFPAAWSNHTSLQTVVEAESWGMKGFQNLAKPDWCLLFYPALFYRSGASLKLMLSKFGVSNCCFTGFALNLYNSPVPEVRETWWGRFTVCLPSPKCLWQQDTLFSVSQ